MTAMIDSPSRARAGSWRRRTALAAAIGLLATGLGLAAAQPAAAADPTGPWPLMIRSNYSGTRSISFQNWSASGYNARPMCWQADPGQWINTGQWIKHTDVITVLAYSNRKCPTDGSLLGGRAGWWVPVKTDGLSHYWLTLE